MYLTKLNVVTLRNLHGTQCSLGSGGTQGITVQVRTDDATDLATAKDGVSAGYLVLGSIEIPLEKIVAGNKFAFKVLQSTMKKYAGGWLLATSTTYTGTITVDQWLSDTPVSENEDIQKTSNQY